LWPTNFSDIAKVTDIFLSLDVSFEAQALDGFVVLTVEKVDPAATHVVRDFDFFLVLLPSTTHRTYPPSYKDELYGQIWTFALVPVAGH
jgi:hypothetical protein